MVFLRTQINKEQIIFIAHVQHPQQQLIEIITIVIVIIKKGPYSLDNSHHTGPCLS